jgi:hypothetical protein
MECFGTTDFDNNNRLITLSVIIISGVDCININVQCIMIMSGFIVCYFDKFHIPVVSVPNVVFIEI